MGRKTESFCDPKNEQVGSVLAADRRCDGGSRRRRLLDLRLREREDVSGAHRLPEDEAANPVPGMELAGEFRRQERHHVRRRLGGKRRRSRRRDSETPGSKNIFQEEQDSKHHTRLESHHFQEEADLLYIELQC